MKIKSYDKWFYLLKGLLLAFIITSVLIVLFSLLLTYSTLKESKMPLINTIIMMVSITTGSIYAGKKIKEKGWVNGGIVGILYYIILILLSIVILNPFSIDLFSITKLIIAFITGVIGGIIGINI
ncbi:TIGR04086 family membrane protein [Tissierella sp.]|uniref:TIGR04086 family membrane protein n=1 Tax=Tissierella sp. TaxID=41274 RepID=UPI0028638430|nr:TIGR04086 family membrane protein [Tissierella sp.]MDR7856431.1 TIGR04086 family membrane protein [Tissierella sp.]